MRADAERLEQLPPLKAAATGQEALATFRTEKFDVVITDQAMPEMMATSLPLPSWRSIPSQPIILLTRYGEPPQGGVHGAIGLLINKPVSLARLRQALSTVWVFDAPTLPESRTKSEV